jgi:hypothetical protein
MFCEYCGETILDWVNEGDHLRVRYWHCMNEWKEKIPTPKLRKKENKKEKQKEKNK